MQIVTLFPSGAWLLFSVACFAGGEYFSERFALNPSAVFILCVLLAYGCSELLWLPALLERNSLAVTGTLWSVMSLLATVSIGTLVFHERLTPIHWLGVVLAFAAILLLSI